ncbi:hypothetical protein MKW98_028505 [Papaver atlanticum]|uniref:Uncharacterized protein n=1 Tax=Papaver atlanticum TaxID=357466 RepID=A0AAD4XVN9_9MAGN|nr:hypothetical protein MKW98_028505 [Papaver atlanticum]
MVPTFSSCTGYQFQDLDKFLVSRNMLKPNLDRFNNPPDWQEILTYFRGSELQNYFTRILEDNLKSSSSTMVRRSPPVYLTTVIYLQVHNKTSGLVNAGYPSCLVTRRRSLKQMG